MKEELREKKSIYAREWRDANKDRVNIQVKERRENMTEERAEEFRILHNERCKKYSSTLRGSIANTVRSRRHYAKKLNLPFELSIEWYEEKLAEGCAVTGLPLEPPGTKTPWTAHIDKIVPELGYTIDNSRLVCAIYNMAKWKWGDEDVLKMASNLLDSGLVLATDAQGVP